MRNIVSTAVRLAACVAAAALVFGLLLPACVLNRSIALTHHRTYTITEATIRNLSDGTDHIVSLGDTTLDPMASPMVDYPTLAGPAMDPTTDEFAGKWFKRYLKHHLEARASEDPPNAMFVMTFGPGAGATNWCLVSGPTVAQTSMGAIEGVLPLPAAGTQELAPCDAPAPPACNNEPGMTPILQFNPPSPFTFSDVNVGSDSGWVPITLTNGGTGTLCLDTGRDPQGDTESFSVQAPDSSDPQSCVWHTAVPDEVSAQRVLLSGTDSCTLNVRFHPTSPGLHVATVPVTSNDATTPGLALRGTAVGGQLTVSADPPSRATGTTVCVTFEPTMPGVYGTTLHILNEEGGTVTIESGPTDMNWPIDTVMIDGGTATPTPPWVLAVGRTLSFRVRAIGATTSEGLLSFAGTQPGSPLNIMLNPSSTCS